MQDIPEALVVEARAEIMWGKNPDRVLALLQAKGVGDKSALELISRLQDERAQTIRSDGIRMSIWGAAFLAAPFTYYAWAKFSEGLGIKTFAVTIVIGAFGIAKLTNGLTMVLRPGSVKSDLANSE